MKAMCAALIAVAAFTQTGCIYLKHRGADLTDVITLSVEQGNVGATVGILGLPWGVSWSEGQGVGLRSGYAGAYQYKEKVIQFIRLEKDFTPGSQRGSKGYHTRLIAVHSGPPRPDDDVFEGPWQMYWQLEANVGLYGGVRVGFNAGEFFDFVLGWSTLDICNDDVPGEMSEPVLGAAADKPRR